VRIPRGEKADGGADSADSADSAGGADSSRRLRLEVADAAVEEVLELLAAGGTIGTWSRSAGDAGSDAAAAGRHQVDAWFAGPSPPPGLADALRARGAVWVSWQPTEPRDWLEEYRRSARPVRIGRFELDPREPDVAPPEEEPPEEERPEEERPEEERAAGVRRLRLPARSAFGTGSHETTRLMVEALEELELAGRSVLDVGTGTGVLAFVARALGGARVIGFDVDPVAPLLARQNAALNRLPAGFFAGTVEALSTAARFDLVLVNVLPENLAGCEPAIAARIGVEGELLVSGVLVERAAGVEATWLALGLERVSSRGLGEWTLLRLRRR
jgi:ribosomal protein L11 methyltransferase